MLLTAFLLPPLLLCAVLALGRYEEFLLGPRGENGAEPVAGRHLRAVPDLEVGSEPVPTHRRTHGRRHAA
ncbi:hypothetical protein ACIRP0_07760 [Streptomyces sp. NPDC101733]|uniref:hypothetical protein n=1 Tax=unclassified Streptomyces TaxID=2593676 RepID=UPI0038197401